MQVPAQQPCSVLPQPSRAEASPAIALPPRRLRSYTRIATGTPGSHLPRSLAQPVQSAHPEQVSPRQRAASLQRYGEPVSSGHFRQLNRLAHKAIVRPIAASVYTARSGRLPFPRVLLLSCGETMLSGRSDNSVCRRRLNWGRWGRGVPGEGARLPADTHEPCVLAALLSFSAKSLRSSPF
jgi:hypothetical protein